WNRAAAERDDWHYWYEDQNWAYMGDAEFAPLISNLPESLKPESRPTMEGFVVDWPDPEGVASFLAGSGIEVHRDDELLDKAIGPSGRSWHSWKKETWECNCGQPDTWDCECHPGPTIWGQPCPSCGTDQLVPIAYGYPSRSDSPDVVLGGCIIGSDRSACRACSLYVDSVGGWSRKVGLEHGPVPKEPVPPLERGLTILFAEACELLGEPIGTSPEILDALVPIGLISGAWWSRIRGLSSTCTCLGDPSSEITLASYTRRRPGGWTAEIGEWLSTSVGVLHIRSIEEPVGSAIVRRPDGRVVGVRGPNAGSLLEEAAEQFGLAMAETVTARRRSP
ncbi:MAG TPA: hypothetical protein VK070_06370, partial [Acidimicrobiia bacterium]|nr:hypothetical protein [Acidimicrobiia bacterium]